MKKNLILPFLAFFLLAITALLFLHFKTKQRSALLNILQTGPHYVALKTVCLAEILDLSSDEKVYLEQFDLAQAKKKILATHVIEKVVLKKIKPHTLYIDYSMREPIAYVEDLSNTMIDEQGILFPASPFYTPKNLPTIRLGISKEKWGDAIEKKKIQTVSSLLKCLKKMEVTFIDVSQANHARLGKQELVLVLKIRGASRVLRLNAAALYSGLTKYILLEKGYLDKKESYLVDCRIPSIAFFKKEK